MLVCTKRNNLHIYNNKIGKRVGRGEKENMPWVWIHQDKGGKSGGGCSVGVRKRTQPSVCGQATPRVGSGNDGQGLSSWHSGSISKVF